MRQAYQEQLSTIGDDLVAMTRLVGSAMTRATPALLDADLQLAESVIRADEDIDALNAEVEERCFEITALQAPVASDLRVVFGRYASLGH